MLCLISESKRSQCSMHSFNYCMEGMCSLMVMAGLPSDQQQNQQVQVRVTLTLKTVL